MPDSAAISRRERNKQRTRTRILDAARELFTRQGVSATTIDQLAEMADISRATFFNYFESKVAVLEEMLLDLDHRFFAHLDTLLAGDMSTRELLEEFFTTSAKGIRESAAFFRVMIAESEKSFHGPATTDRYRVMTRAYQKIVEKGVTRGEVRTDYPPHLLAEIMAGAYVSVLRVWRTDSRYNLVAGLRDAARLMGDLLEDRRSRRSRR